jgi:hypothetical protein
LLVEGAEELGGGVVGPSQWGVVVAKLAVEPAGTWS